MAKNSLFGDYIIDSNNFKNILLACDRFKRVIQYGSQVYAKVHLLDLAGLRALQAAIAA